jgi:hypothetical protein
MHQSHLNSGLCPQRPTGGLCCACAGLPITTRAYYAAPQATHTPGQFRPRKPEAKALVTALSFETRTRARGHCLSGLLAWRNSCASANLSPRFYPWPLGLGTQPDPDLGLGAERGAGAVLLCSSTAGFIVTPNWALGPRGPNVA